jgi:hypothetical protein
VLPRLSRSVREGPINDKRSRLTQRMRASDYEDGPRPSSACASASATRSPPPTTTTAIQRPDEKLQRRQEGQPAQIINIAWRAQRRLNARLRQLRHAHKPNSDVAVAIARELAAFCWELALPALVAVAYGIRHACSSQGTASGLLL